MEKEKALLDQITLQFAHTLENDFGFPTIDSDKGRWYQLTWEEFKKEAETKGADFSKCSEEDWKQYFQMQKGKVMKLQNGGL